MKLADFVDLFYILYKDFMSDFGLMNFYIIHIQYAFLLVHTLKTYMYQNCRYTVRMGTKVLH